jgi:aryl-alcohol dehydrogenase-like predicted oxidoreductase
MRYRPLGQSAHLAAENGHTPFISAQNHWSLLERQAESDVVPAARHFGLSVLPYFPLANGLLTGKVRRGQAIPAGTRLAARQGYVTEEKLAKVEALSRRPPPSCTGPPRSRRARPNTRPRA